MNSTISRQAHLVALIALIGVSILAIVMQFVAAYPPEYANYRIVISAKAAVVAILLAVRIRQVVSRNIVADPRSPLQSASVSTGVSLIFLAIAGMLMALVRGVVSGADGGLLQITAIGALWIGAALIELVIANSSGTVSAAGTRPSRFGTVLLALMMLILGFALGVAAIGGVLIFGWLH